MSLIMFLLLQLSTLWLLGYAIIRALLKQRYGYHFLAVGLGYLVGWLCSVGLFIIYNEMNRPLISWEIPLIEFIVTLPLLIFLGPRECSIEEFRLEKSPSNIVYCISLILLMLICYQWVLQGLNIWGLGIIGNSENIDTVSSPATLVHIIQKYVDSFAIGGVASIPYFALNIAIIATIYGALRYLDVGLFPSLLTTTMISSLPLWFDYAVFANSTDIWSAFILMATVMLWVIALRYLDWRILGIFILFVVVLAWINTTLLLLLSIIILPVLLSFIVSDFVLFIILLICGAFFFVNRDIINSMSVIQSFFIDNNAHIRIDMSYIFITGFIPLLLMVLPKNSHKKGFFLLLNTSLQALILLLVISDARIIVLLLPMVLLIPVSVFHITSKEH